jgi:peptidoglycan/LPS O-acetylase OafA/YrhL
MNPGISNFLNLSRWISAFAVVIYHLRHLILVDFNEVTSKGIFTKALYFFAGLGHEAVMVFFVISGFLVGGLTLKKWQASGPSLAPYFIDRTARIYTVLIPALACGLLLDWIGLHHANQSELYTNSAQYNTNSLTTQICASMDVTTILGNVFMLQGILTEHLGSNGPLWSLSYEWWYYCVFALIAAALTGSGKARWGYAAFAGALLMLLPAKLIAWGFIWLLGILAFKWSTSRAWRPHPAIGIMLFAMVLAASRISRNVPGGEPGASMVNDFLRDFGLAAAYVVALVSASRWGGLPLGLQRINTSLADFSYSTYLCHFPAMVFIAAVGYQFLGMPFLSQPNLYGLSHLLLSALLIYLYCYGFYLLTEKRTPAIKAFLARSR